MNAIVPASWRGLLTCVLRYRREDDELLVILLTFFLCYLLSPR